MKKEFIKKFEKFLILNIFIILFISLNSTFSFIFSSSSSSFSSSNFSSLLSNPSNSSFSSSSSSFLFNPSNSSLNYTSNFLSSPFFDPNYHSLNDSHVSQTFFHPSTFIFRGTTWCGPGNISSSIDFIEGQLVKIDYCCRRHDMCEKSIPAFSSKYGYFNFKPFTISDCECDEEFRTCLKRAGRHHNPYVKRKADSVGRFFFSIAQCFTYMNKKVCEEKEMEINSSEFNETLFNSTEQFNETKVFDVHKNNNINFGSESLIKRELEDRIHSLHVENVVRNNQNNTEILNNFFNNKIKKNNTVRVKFNCQVVQAVDVYRLRPYT